MMGKKGECVKPRNKVAAGFFPETEVCLCRETLISRLGCFPPTSSESQLSGHAAIPSDAGLCMAVLLHSGSGL